MLYHDCVVLGRYCIALLRIQSILFPFQGLLVLRHSLSVCVLHLGVVASALFAPASYAAFFFCQDTAAKGRARCQQAPSKELCGSSGA